MLVLPYKEVAALEAVLACAVDVQTMVAHRGPFGNNALHSVSILQTPISVVCRLIKLNVSLTERNDYGQTPAETARLTESTMLAKLLERAAQGPTAGTQATATAAATATR